MHGEGKGECLASYIYRLKNYSYLAGIVAAANSQFPALRTVEVDRHQNLWERRIVVRFTTENLCSKYLARSGSDR